MMDALNKGTDYPSCGRLFSLFSSTFSTNHKLPRHICTTKHKNKKAPVRNKNLEDFQGSYLSLPEKVTWQNLRQMTTQIYANLTEKKEKKQRRNKNKKRGTVDGCDGGGVADKEGR